MVLDTSAILAGLHITSFSFGTWDSVKVSVTHIDLSIQNPAILSE
jgi:hypothetical protein